MAILHRLFLCVCVLGLGACDHLPKGFSNDAPQMVAEPDKVSALLADAASRATQSLETLAAVEKAQSPGVNVSPISNAPAELRRAVTVNWIGPVEPVAQTLANRAGYQFAVIGAEPPTPLIVSVDSVNQPVIEILRDIGLQMGRRGILRVDGGRRVVEVQYPPTNVPNVGVGSGS